MRPSFLLPVLMLGVAGCDAPPALSDGRSAPVPSMAAECGAPLIMVVTPDLSGSTAINRTPLVEVADLDSLIERTVHCGGELALGEVSADSDQPLLRVYVPQPLIPPTPPAGGRSPLLARQERDQYARQVAAFRNGDSLRVSAAERDAGIFRQRAEALLVRRRTARRSDVNGAVGRMALYLAEPGHTGPSSAWRTRPRRVAALISDAEENAHRHPVRADFGEDVEFYVVNGDPVSDSLLVPLRAQRFESFTALVRHLLQ